MHSFDVAVLKLKSNESESAKKIYTFMDSFLLSILEAGASAVAVVGLYLSWTEKKIGCA